MKIFLDTANVKELEVRAKLAPEARVLGIGVDD